MNYSPQELESLGIRFGASPCIHRSVVFFNSTRLELGDHVRIDCFSLISAGEEGVFIGRNVHLSASVFIYGGGGRVSIGDFSSISGRVSLYTVNDDYTEGYLSGPTVPEKYRKVQRGAVTIGRHALVGSGSILLPGVTLGTGVSVGALSLVKKDIGDFLVVGGNPLRELGKRGRRLLELEKEFLAAG